MDYIIAVVLGSIAISSSNTSGLLDALCAFPCKRFFVYNELMFKKNGRRRKIKERANLKKISLIFLMLSFTAFMAYHLFLAVNIANEKLQILQVAQKDVAELRIRNLQLVLEKGEVVSMEYIEKEARDKLRYSAEGEVLFVIPEDLVNSEWIEQELELAKGRSKQDEEKSPEEIFQIWIDFLFSNGV